MSILRIFQLCTGETTLKFGSVLGNKIRGGGGGDDGA